MLLNLKAQGKTILLASHFGQDIDELCDTVHEMDQGVITDREQANIQTDTFASDISFS